MAVSHGYGCEFIDSVFDDLYCKKCNLVARRLAITTCCGESFCQACITDTQEQGDPCPVCGVKEYNIIGQVKNQKRINSLRVHCSLKERGCDWTGLLEQLDTHLDPDQDNCQYVDTKCPLNCSMVIPKNKVEQHVAEDCAKRPYVCQHCNFKATYEDVVEKHLAECKYVPLQCPNLCGVTFERDFMEDHMKTCRLEEVGCEFRGVGCEDLVTREDKEEHTRQNSQKHLTLTASLALKIENNLLCQKREYDKGMETLEQKIEEQDKKIKQQEKMIRELQKKTGEQEMKIGMQERMLEQKIEVLTEQMKKMEQQERKMLELENQLKTEDKKLAQKKNDFDALEEQVQLLEQQFDSKLQQVEKMLKEESIIYQRKLSALSIIPLNRKFEMLSFSSKKAKNTPGDWKGPAMYTHVGGYKFCIGVDANGCGIQRGRGVDVALWSMPGELDDLLKWPVNITLTVELINQQGGGNVRYTGTWSWDKPEESRIIVYFRNNNFVFLEHSKLSQFLNNDTLYFYVSEVKLRNID